jgi:hypothetical protein
MEERRDNSRIDISGDLTYEACSSLDAGAADDRQRGSGTVINVSGSGLCIDTADAVRDTQIVRVNVPLPGSSVKIPTLAMVMWKKPIDGGSRVGMMFVV